MPEFRSAGARTRERVLALAGPAVAASAELIDYDEVWRAKRAALELLVPDRSALRQLTGEDAGRGEFALFCTLAEEHGPDWRRWPAALRDPASAAVGEAAGRLADRVGLHAWIQLRCAEQLADVQAAAASSGLRAGVIHDLPVGVDPAGADAWAMQDALAGGVTVGAPPDVFNQRGQDWGLPPWRPYRLAATGYAPLRDVVHRCLAHADGLRVDHVAGLWRLWWVPSGSTPDRGSYVRYDADAMLAVLAIEAERAGATVIGEDLGTVEPVVTETLHDKGMASSAVLWFQRPGDEVAGPLQPAAAWPAPAMASISTHDLPTAAGFLRAEHVRVRAALGQLACSEADELAAAAADRRDVLDLLAAEGLLPAGSGGADAAEPSEEDLIVAMHVLLARTPCRLAMVALTDVLGDARQPNLPGTVDEYP
ncbi:MAG: 4-alpha-glucanotransferase, partial [Mycobacteriales bacterium]